MSVFVERLSLGGDGPRVAVKDTIDVAGVRTRAGSRAFQGAAPAARHADAVQRLLSAGCRIVGKTVPHELAYGVTGVNRFAGTPLNPIDPRRIPGGSSSGSAVAVATDEADIGLGTDTGGSIRIPAACCGIIGLKPSFGRVSRSGVMPASSSLDCVGPMARDMEGIVFAMRAIAPGFAPVGRVAGARVVRLRVDAEPAILAAIDAVLPVPFVDPPDMEAAFEAGLTIIGWENWAAFGHLAGTGLLGGDVAARLSAASDITRRQLEAAEAVRVDFRQQVDAFLEDADILALPTLPTCPPLLGEAPSLGLTAFVRPFNLSGHPAISVPVPTAGRFPAGLQLVGRHGEDEQLCAIAGTVLARTEENGHAGASKTGTCVHA
ncbi:MAG: amidase [Sphingomonadales bacterium]